VTHDLGAAPGVLQQLHVMLALGITVAYLTVPFTALRLLPVTTAARVFGLLFFATCAITHLALSVGVHEHPLMLANDAVQLVAIVGFIRALCRQVAWTMRRREQLRHARPTPGGRGGNREGPP
jgi:hypothetical protein